MYLLRSKDRTPDSVGSHNFTIDLKSRSIDAGQYDLVFLSIQNTVYTVRNGINNKIYFNENSTNKTATVAAGYYTDSTLPAAIKSALDSASGGFATFTVTISGATKKTTITSTQNFSLTFGTNTSASIARILGFNKIDTSAATSHTASNIINLSEPLSATIRINQATAGGFYGTNGSWGQIIIPLDFAFGYFKTLTNDSFRQTLVFNDKASKLEFEVKDLEGNPLDLNGSDFEMLIRKV